MDKTEKDMIDKLEENKNLQTCPICWSKKPENQFGWVHLSYGETVSVCSQECSDLVGDNFNEFYNNFYDKMAGIGERNEKYYGQLHNVICFKDWLNKDIRKKLKAHIY